MMYFYRFFLALLLSLSASAWAENPYSPEETHKIKDECIELGTRYAYYLDSNQIDKISSLFDEFGSFQGSSGKYIGRENIDLAFSRRPKNRRTIHLVTNHYVDIQSKNMAEVTSNFAAYRTDEATGVTSIAEAPVRIGRYIDECVRQESGWFFQSREMNEVFSTDG